MQTFRENLDDCNLLDLGFSRPRFTWSNLRQPKDRIMERLDRCLAKLDWTYMFSNAQVTHLTRTHSDHSPITLSLFPITPTPPSGLFKLETMWLTNLYFDLIVHKSWPTSSTDQGDPDQLELSFEYVPT